jgi:F-type H+-transporting ATPase subunit delta
MSLQAVASRYAQAVFELGLESGELGAICRSLAEFAALLGQHEPLRRALENPLVAESDRGALVQQLTERLRVTPLAAQTLRLLVKRRRLGALGAISARLSRLNDEREGVIRATVTSARPLLDGFGARLKDRLENELRRRVELVQHTDPSLIAGVIVRIGDNTYDGSLRGQLTQVASRLLPSV